MTNATPAVASPATPVNGNVGLVVSDDGIVVAGLLPGGFVVTVETMVDSDTSRT